VLSAFIATTAAESRRRQAVVELRRSGMTWRAIGQAMNLDHAALHRRYAEHVDQVLVDVALPRPRAATSATSERAAPLVQQLLERVRRGEGCVCGDPGERLSSRWLSRHVDCLLT
jgi:hypothetical protein